MTGDNTDDGMMLSRRDAIRGGAALGTMALASRIGAYAQVVEAQITEPRIQLGSDYAIHDNGGNLVINHDPNGNILEYDATADEITTLKPLGTNLDLSDNDITNVVALTADSATIAGNTGTLVLQEDDNSPWTASGASSITATLADAFDVLQVFVTVEETAGGSSDVDLQVNGDTGANYLYTDESGTTTTSASNWPAVMALNPNENNSARFSFFEDRDNISFNPLSQTNGPEIISKGSNFNVTHPLDSVTFTRSENATWTVEAFGRSL